jgi:RNA polymerase sigma-70 factor (TIGR02960 family)
MIDEPDFAQATELHRRELHVHCYRTLGSFEEAEDAVQETMLRAWRARSSFDGTQPRAWLYRIATNACLDAIRSRKRRAAAIGSFDEMPWLQPYPDRLLDEIAPSEQEPDAVVVARETIELAFLAVIQLLPPRQRAVLIMRDVLEWSAAETAAALEMTVAGVNSALQRAKATLREQPEERFAQRTTEPSEEEMALLHRFIEAHERGDQGTQAELLREDVRVTMPPHPMRYDGVAALQSLMATAVSMGEWKLVPIVANRMPAAASYLRAPGDTTFKAFKIDVLRIADGRIAEITTFDHTLFAQFGLEGTLQAS